MFKIKSVSTWVLAMAIFASQAELSQAAESSSPSPAPQSSGRTGEQKTCKSCMVNADVTEPRAAVVTNPEQGNKTPTSESAEQ